MENMELTKLTAISPIDGRYRDKCEVLADYFSEYALIRYRVLVEVEYFIALCELPLPQLAGVDTAAMEKLRDVYRDFSEADALRVKEIEQTTNHDRISTTPRFRTASRRRPTTFTIRCSRS